MGAQMTGSAESNEEKAGHSGQPNLPRTTKQIAHDIIEAQNKVDLPIITQCRLSPTGLPSFIEGTPYLVPENVNTFLQALRTDVSLMSVIRAKQVFRQITGSEPYPVPESCTPYLDANGLGFYLKTMLPLVFVKANNGDLFLDARVAVKYLRENSKKFPAVLDKIGVHASRILLMENCGKLKTRPPWLFTDIVQPYRAFTDKHISIRAGLWVQTPPGINTVIGPPINQNGQLSIITGAIETDWHHFELFVVAEVPRFEGQVLIVEPDTLIAQMHFVARFPDAELRFSLDDPGGDRIYHAGWEQLGDRLVQENAGRTLERSGVASIDLSCPHCFVSVTAAAEQHLPEGHVFRRGFNPAYKILKREYHSVHARQDFEALPKRKND